MKYKPRIRKDPSKDWATHSLAELGAEAWAAVTFEIYRVGYKPYKDAQRQRFLDWTKNGAMEWHPESGEYRLLDPMKLTEGTITVQGDDGQAGGFHHLEDIPLLVREATNIPVETEDGESVVNLSDLGGDGIEMLAAIFEESEEVAKAIVSWSVAQEEEYQEHIGSAKKD